MTTTSEPRLLPWLRTGMATQISAPATGGVAQHSSTTVRVSVQLQATGSGPDITEPVTGPALRLRAPGEVVGLDAAQVLRCYPEAGATDAEPNYFTLVELAAADLPWRYTPAAASQNRLQPWIALVVVADGPGGWLEDRPGSRCPLLHVPEPAAELPDPTQSWAWAHVHCDDDLADGATAALAAGTMRARLLCPRRLTPNRSWLACLVPTFETARQSGGGGSPADRILAWDPAARGEVVLPAYYHWRFQTGPHGDFESLVRRLRPRELAGTVGRRDLDISRPGGGLPAVPGTLVSFAGALVSPGGTDRTWDPQQRRVMKQALRQVVNESRTRPAIPGRYQALVDDPVVGPPAYAGAQAHLRFVPETGEQPLWFEELATEPDRRAVAGLAAQVVRRDQEALMGVAWQYAAGMREVNQLTTRARVAWEVGSRAVPGFRALADETLLQVAGPALSRLPSSTGGTIRAAVADSALPGGLVSGAFRRTCQTARGLATRSATTGAVIRPTTAVTRDFLAGAQRLVSRWATVKDPAGSDVQAAVDAAQRAARPAPAGSGDVGPLAADVRAAIDPPATVRRMLDTRIAGIAAGRQHDAPPALAVSPTFSTPMYARLAALGVEPLVPGVDAVPDNTLGLLEVNRTFVEAFLAGLNHEMGRELRWREYPTALDNTWFLRFWDTVDGSDDILPIDAWRAGRRLGANAPRDVPQASLVLLVTGPLLRRYPDVRIYAVPAQWSPEGTRVEDPDGTVALPVFTGVLRPGVAFFGFALAKDDARGSTDVDAGQPGYFFVLEEPTGALRFGLDAAHARDRGTAPAKWNDLSWAHLSPVQGSPVSFVDTGGPDWIVAAGELTGNGGPDSWGEDAAAMGRITVQRPVRMLVHADSMLPQEAAQ